VRGLGRLWQRLVGCRHRQLGFPITERTERAGRIQRSCYRACLACGYRKPFIPWEQRAVEHEEVVCEQ